MFKIVAVIQAKDGLAREQFLHHWHVEHPEFVRRLPGIHRYRQNHSIDHRSEWPFDGIAEIWFESLNDIRLAYAGPEAKALMEHEALFIADLKWSITEEREIDVAEQAH